MKRIALLAVAGALVACAASDVRAQLVAPVATAPVVVTSPAYAYTVARPIVVESPPSLVVASPAPTVAYYQPAAAVPAPVVTYYRAPVVSYAPSAQVVTRYRPILGGTVTRVRPALTPVVY
jgi:hypothetical protein